MRIPGFFGEVSWSIPRVIRFAAPILVISILSVTHLMAGAGPRGARRQGAGARGAAALLQSLPIPVRHTIQVEMANGTLDDVTRTNSDDGDVIYDVDFTRLGDTRNMTVALDGRLLDIQVFLPEVPFPARRSLTNLCGAGQMGVITKNFDIYGGATFDAEITKSDGTRDYMVDDEGILLDREVFLAETSPAAQKVINAKVGSATLEEIMEDADEEGTSYEVVMNRGGVNRTFSVSTNGDVIEEQVFVTEIPPVVQKAIQAQSARGRFGKINKSSDSGKDYYEVEIRLGINTIRVTFNSDGVVVYEEEDMAWGSLPGKIRIALHPIEVAGEEVDDIMRSTEGTNTTYDVELRNGKNRRTLTFDPDGKIIPP